MNAHRSLYITVASFCRICYNHFILPSPHVAPPNGASSTELDPANVPDCCAGVQLNLAKPDDPSVQVQVLVDGTLHPANQVVRNGSFLYIMGLQSGTEYTLNISLSNVLGTVWVNTTVRPLLGEMVSVLCTSASFLISTHFTLSPTLQAVPPPHK